MSDLHFLPDCVGSFHQVLNEVARKRAAGGRAPAGGKPNHAVLQPNRPHASLGPEGRESESEPEAARMIAILAHGRATGQGDLARHLALNTTLTSEAAIAAMDAARRDRAPTSPATSAARSDVDQRERGLQIALAAIGRAG